MILKDYYQFILYSFSSELLKTFTSKKSIHKIYLGLFDEGDCK